MPEKVKPVREGEQTVTAHLMLRGAAKAVEFYQKAFGANLMFIHTMPDGKVMHASLKIGNSTVMLADDFLPPSTQAVGGGQVMLNLVVEDVDALWEQAVAAGAKVTMPLADMFWGDRYGQLVDPYGQTWALLSHVEEVPREEMERRAKVMYAQMTNKANA